MFIYTTARVSYMQYVQIQSESKEKAQGVFSIFFLYSCMKLKNEHNTNWTSIRCTYFMRDHFKNCTVKKSKLTPDGRMEKKSQQYQEKLGVFDAKSVGSYSQSEMWTDKILMFDKITVQALSISSFRAFSFGASISTLFQTKRYRYNFFEWSRMKYLYLIKVQ